MSGNARHSTGTGGPAITQGNDGLSFLNFSNSHFLIPQMTWMYSSYFTIFVAEQYTGGSQRAGILASTDAGSMFLRIEFGTSFGYQMPAGSYTNQAFTAPAGQTRIWSFTYNTTDAKSIFLNGTSIFNTTTGSFLTTNAPSVIGATGWNLAGEAYIGRMREMMCFQGSMTAANRQLVEGYLACKWNVQSNLATSHPYYALPTFLQWNQILGSRILGSSPYVPSGTLLTTTIGNSQTALFQVGPITSTASSKLFIVANMSLFAPATTNIQLTVGRHTTSGAAAGSSTNIVSSATGVALPISSSNPAYFMAAANTTVVNQAIALKGSAVDIPGAVTFYYTIWASSSATAAANSTIVANLNVIQV